MGTAGDFFLLDAGFFFRPSAMAKSKLKMKQANAEVDRLKKLLSGMKQQIKELRRQATRGGGSGGGSVDAEDNALARRQQEWEWMKSVLYDQRSAVWGTNVAHLLAERGEFAVFADDKKARLAVLPSGTHKWIPDVACSTEVTTAILRGLAKLKDDLASFDPAEFNADADSADEDLPSVKFETSIQFRQQLRQTLLPALMQEYSRVVRPRTDCVYCNDGMLVVLGNNSSAEAAAITAADYCTHTTGFSSNAIVLNMELAGFSAWYAVWSAHKQTKLIEYALACAFFRGVAVAGELGFHSRALHDLVMRAVGDYTLCQPGPLTTVTMEPPPNTTPEFIARAAFLANADLDAMFSSTATTPRSLRDLQAVHTQESADAHACHILYSSLRTSQIAREEPRSYFARLIDLKTRLEEAGSYKGREQVQRVLDLTFVEAPKFVDANTTRAIDAKGFVLTGVHLVRYNPNASEIPRSWVAVAMKEKSDLEDSDVE